MTASTSASEYRHSTLKLPTARWSRTMCLDTVLCFRHNRRVARDNTVKYKWRTLQLLPGTERRSYAGAVIEMLESLDGQLAVRYQGEIIPSQEASPRPGILRSFNGSSSYRPVPHRDLNGLGRRWEATLAALDAGMDARDADDTVVDNGAVRVRKAPAMSRRKPTPLQTARWNAVQKAKQRGLSIRGVAPGTAYTSCHCQEVHRSRQSTHKALRG